MRSSALSTAAVTDEPAPFIDLEERLAVLGPLGHLDLAAQKAGLHAHEGQGFGEREGGAHLLAVLARLHRRGTALVAGPLLGGAAFVDGRKAEVAREAGGRRPGVHPCQLEGRQRHGEVLRALDEPALLGVEEHRGDAALVEILEKRVFLVGPVVAVAPAAGDDLGHRTAGHRAHRLHQHRQIVAFGEAPLGGAQIIGGQRAQHRLGGVGVRSIGSAGSVDSLVLIFGNSVSSSARIWTIPAPATSREGRRGENCRLTIVSRCGNIPCVVVETFACSETELIFRGCRSRKLPA